MQTVGDKIVLGQLTYRELLVIAYAFGGADGQIALNYADQNIAAMDRREREKAQNNGAVLGVIGGNGKGKTRTPENDRRAPAGQESR